MAQKNNTLRNTLTLCQLVNLILTYEHTKIQSIKEQRLWYIG